jgi:hypothetical protein
MPLALLFVLMFSAEPAFTQSAPVAPTSLQARVDAAAAALASNPKFKRRSPKERQQITEFVAGNMLFVLLHEIGHAVTTQMGIPILGKKEDAADAFAVTRLIKLDSGFSDHVLTEAGKGFFLSARRDKKNARSSPIL